MAYSAAALSYMLSGQVKPVIFTGSQLPIAHPLSDAPANLAEAFLAATSGVSGVYIAFNRKLIPGARADVAYAVINGNNATLVDLVPYVDGLYAETADSEAAEAYVNVVVVKPENAEAEWVKALEQVIYTQKVYDLIVDSGFAPTFEVPAAETAAE